MNEEKLSDINDNTNLIKMKVRLLNTCIKESITLIEKGNEHFRKIFFENDEDIALISFLLLSRGFELLMKIILIIRYFKDNNKFLTSRQLKNNYGHNLIKLKDEISRNYQSLKSDDEELKEKNNEEKKFFESQELEDILRILNHFANASEGRYYAFNFLEKENMNAVTFPIQRLSCNILNRVNDYMQYYNEFKDYSEIFDYFHNKVITIDMPIVIIKLLIILAKQLKYSFLKKPSIKVYDHAVTRYSCMTERDIFYLTIKAFQDELNKKTLNNSPIRHAETQIYLGTTYANLANFLVDLDDKNDKAKAEKTKKINDYCNLSIKAHELAQTVYLEDNYPGMHKLICEKIKNVNDFKENRRVAKKYI